MARDPTLADVRARRAEIAKAVGPLMAEDDELKIAEKVLARLAEAPEPAPTAAKVPPPTPPPRPVTSPAPDDGASANDDDGLSLEETVRQKLTGNENLEDLTKLLFDNCSDDWWTATEVQDYLTRVKGKEVPMSSVSPTLTKLKDAGVIVRDGLKVALKSRVPQLAISSSVKNYEAIDRSR